MKTKLYQYTNQDIISITILIDGLRGNVIFQSI